MSILLKTERQVDRVVVGNTKAVAVATSSLNGQFWDGACFILKDGNVVRSIEAQTGVSALSWIGNKDDVLAFGGDDGSIQLWAVVNTKKEKPLRILNEHFDIVTDIKTQPTDRDVLLSSSWDLTIKLWPARSPHSSTTFEGHFDYIWSVDWNKRIPHLFASASQDHSLKLWDQNQAHCVATIKRDHPLFVVRWDPTSEHIFATGDEAGTVAIFDTRNTKEELLLNTERKRSVRAIEYSPKDSNLLALGSDDTTVSLLSTKENKLSYQSKDHNDFVRSIAFNEDGLSFLSGSWDRTVRKHDLPTKE